MEERARAVVIFIGMDPIEFCGVHFDVGAHFPKMVSTLVITLVTFIAPGKVVIPWMTS